MPNYTLPTESVSSLSGLFVYSHEASSFLLGNLVLVSIFLIILFYNLQLDGFKKRITYAFLTATLTGLFLLAFSVVSGFIFGIFAVGSVLCVLWVGFTQ